MHGIFISYRRGDHIDVVSTLGRRLVDSFGSDQVFLDTESLRPGDRFPGKLEKAVLDSAVVRAGAAAAARQTAMDCTDYDVIFGPSNLVMQSTDCSILTEDYAAAAETARRMPRDSALTATMPSGCCGMR